MSSNRSPKAKSLRATRARKSTVKKNQVKSLSSAPGGQAWIMPRRGIAYPDSLRTNLKYIIPLQQILGGGTTNSLRFTSNAYDVDSALASTAMAYFAELALVYSRFRTLGMKYQFHVSNQELFPQAIIHGFATNSIGATALGQNYASGPYIRTDLLSDVRGNAANKICSGAITIQKLFGTPQALYDDLYTGSTTSSTLATAATGNCYIGSVSAAIPVSGWFVTGFIELDVLFTRRNSLFS